MKYQFKEGDGVICDNAGEASALKELAHKNGYPVYGFPMSTCGSSSLGFTNGQFIGTNTGTVKNNFSKKEFIKLITQDKKIVGYKSPIDLFLRSFKAGTIFVTKLGYGYYQPQEYLGVSGSMVPKEIVETWEPVFEEEQYKVIKVGSNNKEIIIFKDGTIKIGLETTHVNIVKTILEDFDKSTILKRLIGPNWKICFDRSSNFIRIGCANENNKFSLKDLDFVVQTHYELNL